MKLLIMALVMCSAAAADAQPLTPQQVEAAIEAGQGGRERQLSSRCQATAGFLDRVLVGPDFHPDAEHFHISFSLTPGRIAALAAAARRLYKPFTPSDVPVPLRTLAVFVEADPHQPAASSSYIVSAIEHVVLKAQNGVVVQPDDFKTERVGWGVAQGTRLPPNRAFARFPVGSVRELPAGEFDVVLVTQGGERRCKVGASDRARLFGGR
jgi:hypothetical protein